MHTKGCLIEMSLISEFMAIALALISLTIIVGELSGMQYMDSMDNFNIALLSKERERNHHRIDAFSKGTPPCVIPPTQRVVSQ